MADFSLALNEDQLQIQKWIHDFAEKVVRPAAHEWDEREEFPYPIVQEAANGREPEKTWTTPVNTYDDSPHGTLDYIFVSPEWRVIDAGLAFDKPAPLNEKMYPSDHLGLYAVLELP